MSKCDTAQICKNGHVATSYYNRYPEEREKYCAECSAETITNCPKCNSFIKGSDLEYGYLTTYSAPAYCIYCGSPFPWTEAALESAKELLILENILSQEELDYFNENMTSILIDTPKTNIVATKLKIFMNKAGNVVASSLRDLVVDIGSETAKKIILGE